MSTSTHGTGPAPVLPPDLGCGRADAPHENPTPKSHERRKHAIVNCADTGPIESLVQMLDCAGYQCHIPSQKLHVKLKTLGGLVLRNEDLVRGMGYERHCHLPETGDGHTGMGMDVCDLYVDIKAHQTYGAIVREWPRLTGKVLWYRINGGKPEHVVNARGDHGDEVNPPCPVVTPNQWYKEPAFLQAEHIKSEGSVATMKMPGWANRAYCCWPPFVRMNEYDPTKRSKGPFLPPICLVHNFNGWGYGPLLPAIRRLGVKVFGQGSPDGLVQHRAVSMLLRDAIAMVHLKSSDAPGYALYEAMAAGCPVVCTRKLIWKCRMGELLVPGETCMVFDRETHDGFTEQDLATCAREVNDHLHALRDPAYNRRIGVAGRKRLEQVTWSDKRLRDVESFREFMTRHFS